jgi:predicted PurR-regulated permease PerM
MVTRTDEVVGVRRRRPAETALVVLAILAVIAAAKIAEPFIVPVIVGTLLSYSLKPLVAMLERVHIHRVIGAALVLTLLGGVIVGGIFLLRDDANAALAELPNAARKVRMAARENAQKPEGPIGHVRAAAEELNRAAAEATSGGKTTTPAAAPAPQPTQIQRWITEQSSKALDVVVDIGIAGLLAYFLLAVGDAFRRKLVRVAGPTLTARRITVEILDEIDTQVQRYLLTMLIINTLIGIATWGILAAFGMEHAALWGVTAAVLHIVPYAGSALTILATGFAAFVQFEVVGRALFVAFAVGVAATAIGMGLSAWIQGRAFQINAVTVFVALLFFGWLWGGWGLLVGVPLLAVAKTTIDRLPSLERFIPLLSDEPKTAPAAIAEKR